MVEHSSPVTEQTVRPFIESALRWHAVFDDGRGGNDLTLDQTADLITARLIAAIGAPAQCAPTVARMESALTAYRAAQRWATGTEEHRLAIQAADKINPMPQ